MEPKSLILFSLAAIVFVSGCAQLGLTGPGGSRCAKGNIETIDADGSLSPEADIDKADLKKCFVHFKQSDNVYAVLQGDKIVSIYKDFDGDKIFSEASDKNILTAQEGDKGTNAAEIESLFYNDIEGLGKYVNLLPAGEASDFVVAAPDIGWLSRAPAFCGDGKLNQPTEECDPPGAVCPNSGICEAGKCTCAAVGSGAKPISPAAGGTESTAEEPSGQIVRLSLLNKMETDAVLSKFKIEFNSDSGNAAACQALSVTIPSGSSKTLALSLKSTGEITSFANVIKSYEIKKAEDELRIGAASATAGAADATVSEIKVESPADRRSTTCKPETEYKIEKKQTHLVDLLLKVTSKPAIAAKPEPSATSNTSALKATASPTASGSAVPGTSGSPTPTVSGAAAKSAQTTASPTSTASATPTATATASATPTPTPTTSAATCSTGSIPAGGCSCGGTLKTSGYCCSGTWSSTDCGGGTAPPCTVGVQASPNPCKCGSTQISSGYCCYNSCTTSYSTPATSCPASCDLGHLSLCNNQADCIGPCTTGMGHWCSDFICRSSCSNP